MAKKKKEEKDKKVTVEESKLGWANLSPERQKEIEQVRRETEGKSYIQQREKVASEQGISSKAAAKQMIPQQQESFNQRQQELQTQQIEMQAKTLPVELEQIKQETTPEALKYAESEAAAQRILTDVKTQEGTAQGIMPEEFRIFMRTAGVAGEESVIPALDFTRDVISRITSLFKSDKKLASTKEVEETFNKAAAALKTDLDLIKVGKKDPMQALINFRTARQALGKLKSRHDVISRNDLVYWVADGKDIGEDIIFFEQILDELEAELLLISGK